MLKSYKVLKKSKRQADIQKKQRTIVTLMTRRDLDELS